MKPIPSEFNDVVTRFTQRLAKLRPESCFREDAEIEAEESVINRLWGCQAADRADNHLDDESAINALIQRSH